MKIIPDTPIGEIAAEINGAIELFEDKKINYFYGGQKSLQCACDQAGTGLDGVLAALEKLRAAQSEERGLDWRDKPLWEIIDHIVKRQHVFIRLRLTHFCDRSADLARSGHLQNPIYSELKDLILDMGRQMEEHMKNEEEVVFPYLKKMELLQYKGGGKERTAEPGAQHLIATLLWKHEVMWNKWILLKALTNEFRPSAHDNRDYEVLCRGLEDFEGYIHQHGQLEDNILFRRAIDMRILG